MNAGKLARLPGISFRITQPRDAGLVQAVTGGVVLAVTRDQAGRVSIESIRSG